IARRRGRNRILWNETDQCLHERRRSAERCRAAGSADQRVALGSRQTCANPRDCRDDQPDERRGERRPNEIEEGLATDAAEGADVAERCDADEDTGDDQRHNDHGDEADERRADWLESNDDLTQGVETSNATHSTNDGTERKPDENLLLELHRSISDSLSASLTAARVRS